MSKFLMLFSSMFILCSFSYGQTHYQFKGNVVNENNLPLTGASVFLYPIEIGSITDANGDFAIDDLPKGKYEIAISFIGYKTLVDTISLVGNKIQNFKLDVSALSLQEVVVTDNYASTIEEARADLVALYFALDEQLIKWGLMPSIEVGYCEYNSYMRGGLMTQLVRVEEGKVIEESHMRNRQLIAKWAFEQGKDNKIVEKVRKDNKTYYVINDYLGLQKIFGKLLKEVQRIKSEGDYEAAQNLVESYGVKVDVAIHKEVLQRWKKLNIAPYAGFINPQYELLERDGKIEDVIIRYPDNFTKQMIYYGQNYSAL